MLGLYIGLCFSGDVSEPGQTLPVFVMRARTTKIMIVAALAPKIIHVSCLS